MEVTEKQSTLAPGFCSSLVGKKTVHCRVEEVHVMFWREVLRQKSKNANRYPVTLGKFVLGSRSRDFRCSCVGLRT